MTMYPRCLARRLRARLDAVPVPERPWAAVCAPRVARRRARRRVMKAVAAAAAVVLIRGWRRCLRLGFRRKPGASAMQRAHPPRYYMRQSYPGTVGGRSR